MKPFALLAGVLILLLAILIAPQPAAANPFGRAARYVAHHKELLAADAVAALAFGADAGSSVHCQQANPAGCRELNPILGPHPSTAAQWSYSGGFAGATIALNHLVWRYAPDRGTRHILWVWTVPAAFLESRTAYLNTKQ